MTSSPETETLAVSEQGQWNVPSDQDVVRLYIPLSAAESDQLIQWATDHLSHRYGRVVARPVELTRTGSGGELHTETVTVVEAALDLPK